MVKLSEVVRLRFAAAIAVGMAAAAGAATSPGGPLVAVSATEEAAAEAAAVYIPVDCGEGSVLTVGEGAAARELAKVLAPYSGKPGTMLFFELKVADRTVDSDMTGWRTGYAYAFAEAVLAVRPGFTNIVAFATDMGILETLKAHFPACPSGFRSRYHGGKSSEYRRGRLTSNPWVWLPFAETPVTTVKIAQDAGAKVLMAPVADRVAYDQARTMGVDAVIAADPALEAFNRKAPPRRCDVIPPGARALGFTKCVVDERNVSPADIKTDYSDPSPAKWYSGLWFRKEKPPAECYTNRWGFLEMTSDCVIMSTPPHFGEKGLLPVLPGKDGFYIEFTVSLSDFHPSHACSLWMYPTKKLGGGGDVPWFLEIDVDEARFGMGLSGTIHSMGEGNPMHLSNYNNVRIREMDRTKPITFGASYDPRTSTCAWWHSLAGEGELEMYEGSPFVPEIAKDEDFFFIVTCRGPEGKYKGSQPTYWKYLYSMRVFVPETSPLPAVKEVQ